MLRSVTTCWKCEVGWIVLAQSPIIDKDKVPRIFWIITFIISVVLCFILIEKVWYKWWYSPVIVSFNERMIPVNEENKDVLSSYKLEWVKKSIRIKIDEGEMAKFEDAMLVCEDPEENYIINGTRNVSDETLVNNIDQSYAGCTHSPRPLAKSLILALASLEQPVHTRSRSVSGCLGECVQPALHFNLLPLSYAGCTHSPRPLAKSLILDLVRREQPVHTRFRSVSGCLGECVQPALHFNLLPLMAPELPNIFPICQWRGTTESCSDLLNKVLTNEGVCYNFNALAYSDIFRKESIQKQYMYLHSTKTMKDWDIASGYSSPSSSLEESESYPRRGQENGVRPDLVITLTEEPENSDDMCNNLYNGFKLRKSTTAQDQLGIRELQSQFLTTLEVVDERQCYFPEDRQLKYFKTYTPSNCRLECLSIYTYRRCNCVWFHMPHTNSSELCTVSKRQCVARAQDELASNSLKVGLLIDKDICNCLPSCISIQYDAEILKTHFDLKKNIKAQYKFYDFNETSWLDSYKFSRVELYFKQPCFVSMRRSELFGLTDFLANCGGLLSLFLGFSVLSVVEIFYFCTLRLWYALKRDMKIEKKQFKESMYKK